MRSSFMLKILAFLIICVLSIIIYQILLTTSVFNHVGSTIPKTQPIPQGKGVGNVKVYLEEQRTNTDQNIEIRKDDMNVMITFTNAKNNPNLQNKFRIAVSSMFKWTTIPLHIYIIGDSDSQVLADNILKDASNEHQKEYKVLLLIRYLAVHQ